MSLQTVSIRSESTPAEYDITIGQGLFGAKRRVGLAGFAAVKRVAIVSNRKIYGLYGDAVAEWLHSAGFEVHTHLIGDGERFKSFSTLQQTLESFGRAGLTRTDGVVALGGGVVGDLAGFAASVHLRGVPFIQVPTTLLSMIDSSVGGKTGINTTFGKNLAGAFYQPSAVLIDTSFLATLPERELVAGFCEAIKQGAIGGKKLFNETAALLEDHSPRELRRSLDRDEVSTRLADLIASQIMFKAAIVAGDERESVKKNDRRSRKILNFGHTFGHALEKVTNYRYLKHGEAVGYGILFAAELSKRLEFLDSNVVNLLNDVVCRLGPLPPIDHIDHKELLGSFKYDKKMIGGSLFWILLKGIGKPVIIDQKEIPAKVVTDTVKHLTKRRF